jgi:hypothetical protein
VHRRWNIPTFTGIVFPLARVELRLEGLPLRWYFIGSRFSVTHVLVYPERAQTVFFFFYFYFPNRLSSLSPLSFVHCKHSHMTRMARHNRPVYFIAARICPPDPSRACPSKAAFDGTPELGEINFISFSVRLDKGSLARPHGSVDNRS